MAADGERYLMIKFPKEREERVAFRSRAMRRKRGAVNIGGEELTTFRGG